MANLSETEIFRNGYSQNLDFMVDSYYRLSLVAVSVVVLFINGISFLALIRTRHIPPTVKFMSTSLLAFDFVSTLIYTARKLIEHIAANLLLQYLAMGLNFLAYINIAIMSVERLVVFNWPNFYLRTVTFHTYKKFCFVVWILYETAWLVDVGLCYVRVDDNDPGSHSIFTQVIERHVSIVYWGSTFVSCICLFKVTSIIAKQSRKTGVKNSKSLQSNKATIIVFICIINYLTTTTVSAILAFTIARAYVRRFASDVLVLINCLVDTCAYVLWFKECRMELFKMFSWVSPSFVKKAEDLRVEVFDIMTYSNKREVDGN